MYEQILDSKSKQFVFSNGALMGNHKGNINTKFCLSWHKKNTSTLEEFLKSVQNFINSPLTKMDISKLDIEYNKIK